MKKVALWCVGVALLGAVVLGQQGVLATPVSSTVDTDSYPQCENCGNTVTLTRNVKVTVSHNKQTVLKGGSFNGTVGVNVAAYTVSATCTPVNTPSCCGKVVVCENPSWDFTASSPSPTVDMSGDSNSNSWTANVYSPAATGEWTITFTATATYQPLKDSEGNNFVNQQHSSQSAEFSGTVSCTFKAIDGPYLLTVSAGGPASNPDPAVVYNNKSENDVKTDFKVSIVKETISGSEDASSDVVQSTYTVTVSGVDATLISCNPLYGAFWTSPTSYTRSYTNTFPTNVTPVIRSLVTGDKTVTLTVSVVMADGTTHSDSETIEFKVRSWALTLLVVPGNLTDQDHAIDVSTWNLPTAGWDAWKFGFGHGGWRINASNPSSLSNPNSPYINENLGTGPGSMFLVVALLDEIDRHILNNTPVAIPGMLKNPDPAPFSVSKNFLVSPSDIEAAITATGTIAGLGNWIVHSQNCVDAALFVAGAAGISIPNCRGDLTLRSDVGERTASATLPYKLAEHLSTLE